MIDNQMNTRRKNLKQLTNEKDRCPIRNVLHHVSDKWAISVFYALGEHGTLRFSEISFVVNGISQKMLTTTLKTLEVDGLVSRKVYPVVPPKVEYTLTELGEDLLPLLMSLVDWATLNLSKIKACREQYLTTHHIDS